MSINFYIQIINEHNHTKLGLGDEWEGSHCGKLLTQMYSKNMFLHSSLYVSMASRMSTILLSYCIWSAMLVSMKMRSIPMVPTVRQWLYSRVRLYGSQTAARSVCGGRVGERGRERERERERERDGIISEGEGEREEEGERERE